MMLVAFWVGAPAATPQIVVNNVQPFGWVAPAIAFVQFVMLFVLTVYTFTRGRSDKIDERKAAWMHTLVVNEFLTKLPERFQALREDLLQASESIGTFQASAAPGPDATQSDDESISRTVNQFQVELSHIYKSIAVRLSITPGGREAAKKVQEHLERFEAEVSRWFVRSATRKAYESCSSLTDILEQGESKFYKLLYDYEFGKVL
jgi:hypothetical protein